MSASTLRFLGTGTAFHDDGRGSQCILMTPESGDPLLVDLGPTALCRMQRFEVDPDRLERVFVTHLHGDHTAGWPFLLLHLSLRARRRRPLDVFGPRGLRRCLEGLSRLCYGELLTPRTMDFEVRYHEIEVAKAEGIETGGLSFDVIPLRHHPTSIGYRFHFPDGRVGVSGDTGWCPDLELLAQDSDLLVIECTFVERREMEHLSLEEIRGGRDRLGRGKLALVHLTDDVAAALAADPIERVVATHDGMTIELA